MELQIIIYLTAFITTIYMASLGVAIYSYINKKRLVRKYYVYFKSIWIEKTRGMLDYSNYVLGLFHLNCLMAR